MFIDELSFNLNSYQFYTALDAIRNVILEPIKSRQERYQEMKNNDAKDNTALISNIDGNTELKGYLDNIDLELIS